MAVQGSPGRQGGPETQFRPAFNQEELRVLRECNRESFYFRSLPFAAALSTAAYVAMRRGVMKPSARFGYTPKILGGIAVGYFIGKLSYQNACAEKLMRLPDSPIGDALRRRKNRVFGAGGGGGAGYGEFDESVSAQAGFSVGHPSQPSSEVSPSGGLADDPRHDLDLTEGLDDYHRVTESLSPYTESASQSSVPPSTNYQELRRQNREDYVHRMAEKYRRPAQDAPPDVPPPSPPSSLSPGPPSTSSYLSTAPQPVKKNQYGDDVYE